MMKTNEIAAEIHRRMCEDDRFGYSWEERYGYKAETWVIDGREYIIWVGDYDCSSSAITAWALALKHTPFAGVLDAATYTGNISKVFCDSGLFVRKPLSFLAETGDLYLNDESHVAMCQTQEPDVLSEFYDYPWDCIMHFVGDGSLFIGGSMRAEPDSSVKQAAASALSEAGVTAPVRYLDDLPLPRYRVAIRKKNGKKKWLPWMTCMKCECGKCSDPHAGIRGRGIVDIEFDPGSLGPEGWFEKNVVGDKLIGLTVFYDTKNPEKTGYYEALYRCHWMGDSPAWGKWEHDDDDGGAGDDADQVDMIELTIAKC